MSASMSSQPPRPEEENVNPPPPTDAAPPAAPAAAAPPKYITPSRRAVIVMVLVALVGIALILRAWSLWPFQTTWESTDNAYVRGQITVLAPQVNGYVTEVLVKDYQRVKKG